MSNYSLFRSGVWRCFVCLLVIPVFLWGCQSSPSKGGANKAQLSSLSASEKKSYDQALAHLANAKFKPAEKQLAQLVESRPNVAELWLNLALSQYHQQSYEQSGKTLKALLARFGEVAEAHNLAGLVAVNSGEFSQAEKHYQNALKLKPSYENALYNMALLQDVYLQNIPAAVAHYDRYLAARPDDLDTKNWTEGLRMSLER